MTQIFRTLTLTALGVLAAAASAAPLISTQSIIVNPIETDLVVRVSVDKDPSGQNVPNYQVGDPVRISTSVNQDAYVYLFSLDSDGAIDQILPNGYASGSNFLRANQVKTFPSAGDGFTFNVAPPYGVSKVLALASKTQLDLSDISDFKNGTNSGTFAQVIISGGQGGLARALSIVVSPIDQRSWTTDTVRYNVAQRSVVSSSTLNVSSNVSGASVFVDDRLVGRTPLSRVAIAAGNRAIRVSANGYSDYVTNVSVRGNETVNVTANLGQIVRTGTLSVNSNVAGAEVFIDNRRAGRTPINISDLNAGSYSIRITAPNYSDYASSVTVQAGRTTNVNANLIQVVRQVTVTVRSNVDQGEVYLDGTRVGSLNNGVLSFVTDRGNAEVVILSSGYRAFVRSLTLNNDTTLTANLARL